MIKLEGRVLLFDTVNINRDIFPKSCKIDIPEKILLCWDFNHEKPIGIAEVTTDDKGLIAKAETFDDQFISANIEEVLTDGKIGVGGFFNKVKKHQEEKLIVIDEATLREISLTLAPVRDEYYLEIVKEE